jgi:hypothetical protein
MSWILAGSASGAYFQVRAAAGMTASRQNALLARACATQAGMFESGHSQWKRRVEACASLARRPRSDTASNTIF